MVEKEEEERDEPEEREDELSEMLTELPLRLLPLLALLLPPLHTRQSGYGPGPQVLPTMLQSKSP